MTRQSGPLEILEVLGDGAFGAVFVARLSDDNLRRLVAVKVLKAEYASNPKVLHRTRDEARLLSKLHHPHVVRVEQLLEVKGRPVLVMELVKGVSLKRLLQKSPEGLPASVAMQCIRLSCVALHAAYNQAVDDDGQPLRVIHRDIKPSNMLLSIHGELKVVDFGIATGQFADREAQTESLVMGSRPYMAPERLDGAADTPAVDIYSAGMSLLELLTGRVMNLSINPAHHDRVMSEALEELSPEGVPEEAAVELRRLIRRMCAYDVDYRPKARDVAAELGRLATKVHPDHDITLERYARETVEPLFAGRRKLPLKEALAELEDSEVITGVFHRSSEAPAPPRRTTPWSRKPAVFFGALAGVVLALSGLAFLKKLDQGPQRSREDGLVRVKVWMPSEARARIGAQAIAVPGHLDAVPGPNRLDLIFDDGRLLSCPFEAADGQALRFVVDRGQEALSVDDGPAVPCEALTPGARAEGDEGGEDVEGGDDVEEDGPAAAAP